MSFTKEDYLAWRNNPVTEGLQEAMLEEMNGLSAYLINNAGKEALLDRYKSGEIAGLRFLVDWVPTVEDPKEEEQTDA